MVIIIFFEKVFVKQSFFRDKTCKVINNGINLNLFKPTKSLFRIEHNLEKKFVILGVASNWNKRKGIDVFEWLALNLDANVFSIVLVGSDILFTNTSQTKNIISIPHTLDINELVQIYSSADLFVNPTREDTFPTVNMESLACGTPVLTFNTGGSPEIIDNSCGSVVECDNYESLKEEIVRIQKEKPFNSKSCRKRSFSFKSEDKFSDYIALFSNICCKK